MGWIEKLTSGDEVYWDDPDSGRCSRYYTIKSIEFIGPSMVRIVDIDGSELECFLDELS